MRLSEEQIRVIKQQAAEQFGNESRVWLFGSRVDDTARGGDIDLYIETEGTVENRASAAARFSASLQLRLGDQRIDVVLVDSHTRPQQIHEAAKEGGVQL